MARAKRIFMRRTIWLAGLIGWWCWPPAAADANCIAPALEILWSYPQDGASDIPIDAEFWVSTSHWGIDPTVTLNGTVLQLEDTGTFSTFRIHPGKLDASTAYTLELTFNRPDAETDTRRIEFTTGDRAREPALAAPTVTRIRSARTGFTSHECAAVIQAQDCFDTGQNTLVTLELHDLDAPRAWLITTGYPGTSNVWPQRCGAPAIFSHNGPAPCFEVSAIGDGGSLGDVARTCVAGPDDRPAQAADGGSADQAADASGTTVAGTGAKVGGSGCSVQQEPRHTRAAPAVALALSVLGLCYRLFGVRRRLRRQIGARRAALTAESAPRTQPGVALTRRRWRLARSSPRSRSRARRSDCPSHPLA